MPSASTSSALALHDSPAPPSTQLIAPFSTRAMAKLAGYGALGPLTAGAVSTALVAGEKPGACPSASAMLHSDASSSSCVTLAPIPGSQHPNSGERGMLASLCLQGAGEVADVGLSPLDQVLLGSASYSISNAVQEQVVAGEMLLAPLATVRFWLLAEEMLPGAVALPLGVQSVSSSPSLLMPFITNDILGRPHHLPSIQPGLLAMVAGDEKLLAGLEPLTSTIRRGGCGMRFAGAPPSGQHLLLGVSHRRRMSSYPFAAQGGGAPRRGYAAATGGCIEENINMDKKIEGLGRRLHLVEKVQEGMLRQRRNGRVALIGIMGFGGTLWHMYGNDLLKKGDETLTEFLGEEEGEEKKKREEEDAERCKNQSLAEICARAIRNGEKREEKEKKKKREEEDAERRKDQSLAEIRARAIRNGEKKEEKKK